MLAAYKYAKHIVGTLSRNESGFMILDLVSCELLPLQGEMKIVPLAPYFNLSSHDSYTN